MNKKFLSAILFGALMVTSTSTFVSCKDYDDDINSLQEQIDAQKSDLSTQISALQSALSAAQSEAAAAAKAQTAADNAAKEAAANAKAEAIADAKAKVDALKSELEGKLVTKEVYEAKVAEIASQIAGIDAKLNTLTTKVDENAAAVAQLEIQVAALEEFKTLVESYKIADNITAINATIDELKESMKSIATTDALNNVDKKLGELATKVADINADLVVLQVTQLNGLVFKPSVYLNGVEATRYPYANGTYLKASANNGDLTGSDDAGVKYFIAKEEANAFESNNTEYNLGSIATTYYHLNPTHAKLEGITWGFLGSDAETVSRTAGWSASYVDSEAEKGVLAVDYKIAKPETLQAEEGLEKLSIFALNATLPETEDGITPVVTSDYSAIIPAVRNFEAIAYVNKDVKTNVGGCSNELYPTAVQAIEAEATIPVQYNKGDVNLDTYFNIHYTQADFVNDGQGKEQVMTIADAKEKWDLKFVYTLLPYTLGDNETSEDAYGRIDENNFYPCYVTTDGTSADCTTESGISAVGKKPVVLVKLVDAEDNVVLTGYAKLQIVKKVVNDNLAITPAFELPYICGEQTKTITWKQASSQIYEFTKLSKDEFTRSYVEDMFDEDGETVDAYILTNGEFKATSNYGVVSAVADAEQGSTNNLIKWTGDKQELDAIAELSGKSVTLYVKFKSTSDIYNYYYIGITLSVLDKPEVTLGKKIPARWFENSTLVKVSVPAPTTEGDVTKFVKDMDDNFEGSVVKVTPTSATQNEKYGKFEDLGIKYNHQFAEKQNKVGDYQLKSNAKRTQVFEEKSKVLIASIDKASGLVTYANNDLAKEVLNLYAYDAEKKFDLNMEIVTTYGDCEIALKNETYSARIQRPVNIVKGSNAKFVDAQANGSSVVLGDLISLTDWRGNTPLITKNEDGKYVTAVENECELYPYYQFANVTVDIANATCDLTGERKKVSEVTDSFKLTSDAETATSIEDVDVFNTIKITYSNNEGNVQQFKLWIPVTIEYAWGKLTTEIEAEVSSTKGSK